MPLVNRLRSLELVGTRGWTLREAKRGGRMAAALGFTCTPRVLPARWASAMSVLRERISVRSMFKRGLVMAATTGAVVLGGAGAAMADGRG